MSTFFFFNDTATTEIYTLSLHDALPISICLGVLHEEVAPVRTAHQRPLRPRHAGLAQLVLQHGQAAGGRRRQRPRSEEHTSELQSRLHLVCRLLLEKKKSEERHDHLQHE